VKHDDVSMRASDRELGDDVHTCAKVLAKRRKETAAAFSVAGRGARAEKVVQYRSPKGRAKMGIRPHQTPIGVVLFRSRRSPVARTIKLHATRCCAQTSAWLV
jgi:hypothetical protein